MYFLSYLKSDFLWIFLHKIVVSGYQKWIKSVIYFSSTNRSKQITIKFRLYFTNSTDLSVPFCVAPGTIIAPFIAMKMLLVLNKVDADFGPHSHR